MGYPLPHDTSLIKDIYLLSPDSCYVCYYVQWPKSYEDHHQSWVLNASYMLDFINVLLFGS